MSRVVALTAAAVVLTGCGPTSASTTTPPAASGDSALGGAPSSVPSASPSNTPPSKTAAGEDNAPAVLADGRSPVLLKKIDAPGRAITFDLVELYTGFDAAKQWLKDHPGQTEAPPLNGLYLVNNNPKLRTLPVASSVVVKTFADADPSTPDTVTFDGLAAFVATGVELFWITVANGKVTLIEQQFVS